MFILSRSLLLALCLISSLPAWAANGYTVVAWNDLGMHCMDAGYSVFALLPPYNTLHAAPRSFTVGRTGVQFQTGDQVTCYSCHNGPNGG